MKMILEEEETEEEKSGVREWMEEDKDKMGNMVDPHYKLQKNSSGQGNLRGGQCHDLTKQLSHYLYFFSYWTYNYKIEHGKVSHNFITISQWCDRW